VFDLFVSLTPRTSNWISPVIYCQRQGRLRQGGTGARQRHDGAVVRRHYEAHPAAARPCRRRFSSWSPISITDYLGRIAFGKIYEGKGEGGRSRRLHRHGDGRITKGKVTCDFHFEGMKRIEIKEAHAGDIVGVTGFEDVFIGETLPSQWIAAALPYMCRLTRPRSRCNSPSTMAPGRAGRQAGHRAAYLGTPGQGNPHQRGAAHRADRCPKHFRVSGRGEMQIAILVEQMRREGTRCSSRARSHLPQGPATATCSNPSRNCFSKSPKDPWARCWRTSPNRKAEITNMTHHGDQVSIEALIPMRGLIGFETDLVNQTRGLGVS
jgi:GTP-binding protein